MVKKEPQSPAPTPRFFKKDGVWVFDSGVPMSPLTVERTLRIVRLERERHALGGRASEVFRKNR